MNFKWYLTEKVRKNELKDIYNDNSILVGGEFEFFIDDLSNMESAWGNIEDLRDQWSQFKNELQEWLGNIEEEQESLYTERSRLEDEKEEVEEEISDIESRIDDIETELEDPEISDEYKKDREDRLENENEDLDRAKKRLDEIEERLSEIEDEEMEVYDRFEFPRAPGELRDFIYEISGGEFDINNIDLIEYLEMPDRIERELYRWEPIEEMVEVDEDAFLDEAKDFLDNYFDFHIITGTSPDKNDNFWGVTIDSTVPPSEGGVELISPPLPMPEFLEAAEDVLDFIRSKGSTDNRCGLHVHMSIEGINLKDDLDVVKLLMFHDEDKVYQAFQKRKFNNYASQVKNKIQDANFDVDDLKKIINVDKLEKNLSTTKYYGINLSNIEKNHIEFRYMGAADYEDKWRDIKEMVGNYAYELKLACDPSFKRQEYIKKLNRAILKQLEMNKHGYLTVLILHYIKDEITKKFGSGSFIPDMERKINFFLDFSKTDFSSVIDNIKMMDYTKKDYSEAVDRVYSILKKIPGFLDKLSPDMIKHLNTLLDSPQKLQKKIKLKYKKKSKFL